MKYFDYYAPYWVILQITSPDGPTYYKLFCSDIRDSPFKLNSGITKIELVDGYYYIHGYSGSVYKCSSRLSDAYRVVSPKAKTAYQRLINNDNNQKELGIIVNKLPITTDFLNLEL